MNTEKSSFNKRAFFKAAIPSYVAPLLFSGLSGYFLNKPDLMRASYSTIALPSLFATIICFALLWQLQKRRRFLLNRFAMTFAVVFLMTLLTLFIIYLFQLQNSVWNILPSVIIGCSIVTLTKPIK